jgi:hypothetical protein
MTKQEEYTLMQNSKPYELKTPVKNSKSIRWLKVWDHRNTPTLTTFKTLTPVPYKHPLISAEEIDLRPIANYTIYKITIKKN